MIHIITGPPCGGKSTYIGKHAKRGDLIVDYDELAMTLGCAEKWNPVGVVQRATQKARAAAIKAATNNPKAESWIIQSRLSEELRKEYESLGAEIVEIDPGKETCIERAKRDGRPKNIFLAIEGWYAGKKGGSMKTKEFNVQYKDEGTGSIEGYASTWIRKADSWGDVVAKGAFTKTLKERWNGGKGIPFIWSHQIDNLDSFIGTAEADEDEKGLHFVATFDDTEQAQKVRQLYKDGRLRKFSFAYDVKEAGVVTLDDNSKANELRELDLYEISAVTVPANDDAGVVDVKSGRRNSKADEDKLKEAIKLLQEVLGEIEEGDPEDGEDDPEGNAGAKDRKGSNPKKEALLDFIKNI
jgi:HK97 family phage prohead protease